MTAEERQKLQRDAAEFERLKNSAAQLAQLEQAEQAEAQAQELDDRICDLSAKLFNDLGNHRRLKSENDQELINLLWDLRTIISGRIRLAERVAEISNVAKHLAYQRMVKSGNLPADFGGQKIELQMAVEQLIMDENNGQANLMNIEIQKDEVIDSLLQTIGRFTGDRLIDKAIRQPPPLTKGGDGVHWIDIPVKEELEG